MPHLFADSANWIDGPPPQLEIQQPSDGAQPVECSPNTFTYRSYSEPDGSVSDSLHELDTSVCATSNELGQFGASTANGAYGYDFIRPYSHYGYRILDQAGHAIAVQPVPNQKMFMYQHSEGTSFPGPSLRFYNDLTTAGTFDFLNYGNNVSRKEMAFQLNTSTEPLKDSAGTPLSMMTGHAFSRDGRWMVIEAFDLGLVRINTLTKQMTLFSTDRVKYGLGFAPHMELAISDDGNTVVRGGIDAGDPFVYDLSGCQSAPFRIGAANNSIAGCRSRPVYAELKAQLSNFQALLYFHFNPDGRSVSGMVKQDEGSIGKYYTMTYSVATSQPAQTGYLALGDSFSSGEGAYDYEPGTDSKNPRNQCHTSRQGYPYLAARAADIPLFHNVACSGARLSNYYKQPQASQTADSLQAAWQPGISTQQTYVSMSGG